MSQHHNTSSDRFERFFAYMSLMLFVHLPLAYGPKSHLPRSLLRDVGLWDDSAPRL